MLNYILVQVIRKFFFNKFQCKPTMKYILLRILEFKAVQTTQTILGIDSKFFPK